MHELHKLIIAGKYTLKEDISPEAKNLLKIILEVDPNKRATSLQILNHPWLKDTPVKLDIFTETEKNIIWREFTYNDTTRLNWNEHFTEHGLDSTYNSLVKNCSTKSVILAPFNSTKTHLSSFHSSVESMIDNYCLVLAPWCWERDRQYQNNNNCELDNGVYNKFVVEGKEEKKEGDSLEDEDSVILSDEEEEVKMIEKDYWKKKEKHKRTELEELEQMIEIKNKEDWHHGWSVSS